MKPEHRGAKQFPDLLKIVKQMKIFQDHMIPMTELDALDVVITDDLNPAQLLFESGSATLDGLAAGVSFSGTTLTANFGATYGGLAPGGSTVRDPTSTGVVAPSAPT